MGGGKKTGSTATLAASVDALYAPAPMYRALPPLLFPLLVMPLLLCACGTSIGDECASSLDCSSQGSRLCDLTQPGGYCTLPGCERGTCPDEAVCVLFRPRIRRLATAYCMYECEGNGDCREGDGYRCLGENDFGDGEMEAEVLEGGGRSFCALPPETSAAESIEPDTPDASPDATPDAGQDGGTDAQ